VLLWLFGAAAEPTELLELFSLAASTMSGSFAFDAGHVHCAPGCFEQNLRGPALAWNFPAWVLFKVCLTKWRPAQKKSRPKHQL